MKFKRGVSTNLNVLDCYCLVGMIPNLVVLSTLETLYKEWLSHGKNLA